MISEQIQREKLQKHPPLDDHTRVSLFSFLSTKVVGLLLGYNGFAGVLSPSCGLLSKLRVLDLSGNLLKGNQRQ